ncbi:MAG: GGDEF domain-containing protein [Ruminococcus sp.]|nr:GGDEF domain-containing protein [Ruminococcus sp.]
MINGKKIAAVCTSRIYDTQQFLFIKKLGEKLCAENIGLMIFALNMDLYWEEDTVTPETEIFSNVPMNLIDILVIMDEKIKSKRVSEHLIRRASARSVPVIVVDGDYDNTISVKYDYAKGFEAVVRHIIEHHGAKKPFMLAGLPNNRFSDERIEIFKRVIEENGIEFNPSMFDYGDFWATPARKAMTARLESDRISEEGLPDAVICANDIMAINAEDVIKKAGYRVPEDIMVSGFDGYDEVNFCSPRITTASCDYAGLAAAVCECIIGCVLHGKKENKKVAPILLPNGSCGCPNKEAPNEILARFNSSFYRFQDDIPMLYNVTVAMQMSGSVEEAAGKMKNERMHDVHCFVYSSCFETERNYFQTPLLKSESNKLSLFFSDYDLGSPMKELDNIFLHEWLTAMLANNTPLIFNELSYLEKPLGLICYSFKDYYIIDYAKTAIITNTVAMGIGGFINTVYQRALSDQLARTYRRDQLTGLYNRAGFLNALERLKNDESRLNRELTVIMADLDGLKIINDTYGHKAGDTAIAEAAAVLKECCPDNALCVRFGGDEMMAVIPEECNAKAIFGAIDSKLSELKHDFRVELSCGAFVTKLTGKFDITEAIKQADAEMYINKRARKRRAQK